MPDLRPPMMTRIIATLGPATADADTIVRLIEEGARTFRINFSHGSFDDYERLHRAVRQAGKATDIQVAVLGDLSGPKIRVGKFPAEGISLTRGDRLVIQRQPAEARQTGVNPDTGGHTVVCSTTYPDMVDDVQIGHRVLIDDGNVRMLVIEKSADGDKLVCHVTEGGDVTTSKGCNLPDTTLKLPSMTDKDWQCVEWSLEHGVDFLALSFVRKAEDVTLLRDHLKKHKANRTAAIPVIAKIETPQALGDIENIVDASDKIMVARGDLGVEMDVTEVPTIQKRIIKLCGDYGKPVIVATQMLQSMIDSPVPTRAEVSDIANAIEDGAGIIMLSGETAVGKFPVQAVRFMARTADYTFKNLPDEWWKRIRPPKKLQESRYRTAAIAHGAKTIVRDLAARAVVMWSQRGGGARYLSQNRLGVPIFAASNDPDMVRRMQLLFGVVPILMDRPDSADAFIDAIDTRGRQRGWFDQGDAIVVVDGEPLGTAGVTNRIRIHYIGDVCAI